MVGGFFVIYSVKQTKLMLWGLTALCVAIGGILPKNGADLLVAGAHLLAVIGGVFDHDPELSAHSYTVLFQDN